MGPLLIPQGEILGRSKSKWEESAGMRGLLQRNLCQVRTAPPGPFSEALMRPLMLCLTCQAACSVHPACHSNPSFFQEPGPSWVLGSPWKNKSINPTPLSYLYLTPTMFLPLRLWCHMLEALSWVLLVSRYINLTFTKGCMPTQW